MAIDPLPLDRYYRHCSIIDLPTAVGMHKTHIEARRPAPIRRSNNGPGETASRKPFGIRTLSPDDLAQGSGEFTFLTCPVRLHLGAGATQDQLVQVDHIHSIFRDQSIYNAGAATASNPAREVGRVGSINRSVHARAIVRHRCTTQSS